MGAWSTLWALIRAAIGLPNGADPKAFDGLRNVTTLCGVPHRSVYRYFWGIRRDKKGPAISMQAAEVFETKTLPTMVSRYVETLRKGAVSHSPCEIGGLGECFYTIRTHDAGVVAIRSLGDKSYFKQHSSVASSVASIVAEHPSAWVVKSQRGDITRSAMQLYPGFQCRHIFLKGALKGRCFQLTVLRDTSLPGEDGSQCTPRYNLKEVATDEAGFAVHSIGVTAGSPNAVWDTMYKELGLKGCHKGFEYCGFNDIGLHHMSALQARSEFGANKNVNASSARWHRRIASCVDHEVQSVLQKLCPSDPDAAFEIWRKSSAFQARGYATSELDQLRTLPFFVAMRKSYHAAPTKELKTGVLSMVAPFFSQAAVCSVFDCKPYQCTAAKLHAADKIAGVPAEKIKHERFRLGGRAFSFLHQWCHSSFAVSASDASSHRWKRLQIRARLYPLYKEMAEQEGVKAVSKDKFNKFMTEGFMDETVETCCCAGCVDGWLAMDMMEEMILDTATYDFPDRKILAKRVGEVREFMAGEYRWKHLSESSCESMHCMSHALSCDCSNLSEVCDHAHVNTCLECNKWGGLVLEVCEHIKNIAHRPASTPNPNCPAHARTHART